MTASPPTTTAVTTADIMAATTPATTARTTAITAHTITADITNSGADRNGWMSARTRASRWAAGSPYWCPAHTARGPAGTNLALASTDPGSGHVYRRLP